MKCWIISIFLTSLLTFTGCPLPTETNSEHIPGLYVKRAIKDATGKDIVTLDDYYLAYSVDEVRQWLERDQWVKSTPYRPQSHDCDDYGLEFVVYLRRCLASIPFGLLRYRRHEKPTSHMANVFVDGELTVWLVNWQLTEEVVKVKGANILVFEVII